ncbi:MAG: methylmalonyl-CoA mutase family protein [Bacteroidales bacterium]
MEEQKDMLFSGFLPVSVAEWENRIITDLKGADYEKKLIRKTLENIRIKPYYTAEDLKGLEYLDQLPGEFPYLRGKKTGSNQWEVRQDIQVHDADAAAEKVQVLIDRGVTSIGFDLSGSKELTVHDLNQLIAAIDLQKVSIHFSVGVNSGTFAELLLKFAEELKIQGATIRGSVDFDPLGCLTLTGGYYRSEKDDLADLDRMLGITTKLPQFRMLSVNSRFFNDCGASAVQELAFGIAMIADYLKEITSRNHQVQEIAGHMQWNLGTGPDYFMEIAKVRAARMLFSALMKAHEAPVDTDIFIHSTTTSWNKTLYDADVNMLRLTTEAMAAILGGCNSLLVKPYDSDFREQGAFSERWARNLQHIIKEESYFDKVVDPAAGSYYIETLTDSLMKSAWELFLKVDEMGGYAKAFAAGFIGSEIGATASGRRAMLATRREILLGTNQYPNAKDTMADKVDEGIAFPEAFNNPGKIAEPLQPVRASVGFEKLRLRTEKQGQPPKVFLLTIGNLAMRIARAQFSGNFFACAGYDIIDNLGFSSASEGVEAAFKADARIVVVCSSDDEYLQVAPEVARLVNGKAIVVVAGAPACMDELKQQGLNEFIHMRSNVLETLLHFHEMLGIA